MMCYAKATTYYFANSGSDGNAGTSTGTPWQTISKFNSVFASKSPGDQFLFNRGDVFIGAMILSRSGLTGQPMFIGAYGTGAQPVITGLTSISSGTWVNLGSNIWETNVAVSSLNDLNMVLINGVNTPMGRTPNSGYLTYQSASSNISITSSSLTGTPNYTGGDVVMKVNNFTIVRNNIVGQSGSTLTYTPTSGDNGAPGYGFFIEANPNTLDVQNEWYFNTGTKKLRIFSTATPSGVQVATSDTLAYIIGKSFITFDNIDFEGANRRIFYIGASHDITIQNCVLANSLYGVWGGNNFGSASTNFVFTGNNMREINSKGIFLQTEFTGSSITHNNFNSIGRYPGMFKVPDKNPLVGGQWGGAFNCVEVIGNTGFIFQYNNIDTSGRCGVSFVGNNDIDVSNNWIKHTCYVTMDGAAIYTIGTKTGGTSRIHDNIVSDGLGENAGTTNTGNTVAHGIYLDDGAAFVEVYNNTAFNFPYSCIYGHSIHDCNIHDNNIYNGGLEQILFAYNNKGNTIQNDTIYNNISVAKLSTSKAGSFQSSLNDIPTFFKLLDNNVWARPIDDNITMETTSGNKTLLGWQALTGKDASATKSVKTITDIGDLRIEINPSSSPLLIALDAKYIDMRGNLYNGRVTLQPYTSVTLVRFGPTTGIVPIGILPHVNHNNIIH